MVDALIVVGLVMLLVEVVKEAAGHMGVPPRWVKQLVVPLAVLVLSVVLNALNAWAFAGPQPGQLPEGAMRQALLDGIQMGAMASGLYSLGKAAMGRS